MSHRVRLTFQDGLIEAEAFGYRGKGCEQIVDDVLQSIGLDPQEPADREPKPEFHLTESEGETQSE